MFPLGHVGIALGVSFVVMRYLKASWNPRLFFIVVGVASIVPDLIDKPTGPLYGYPLGGRLFAHTLVFGAIVMMTCLAFWFVWSRKHPQMSHWPLLFSFGVWVHLILDLQPEGMNVLLWPAYGLGFPPGELSWSHLTDSPVAIAGEIIGAIVLLYLAVLLFLGRFAGSNQLDSPDNR